MIKQVIILRKDLNMSTGKAVAQGSHASGEALNNFINNKPIPDNRLEIIDGWKENGKAKIVLGVKNYEQLAKVIDKAISAGLPYSIILDEGRTEFTEPTFTGGAIGPAPAELIDQITKRLRLY